MFPLLIETAYELVMFLFILSEARTCAVLIDSDLTDGDEVTGFGM